jgi:nascent polypeptide-associated complex subunit alpha
MYRVRVEDLPAYGISRQFIGADRGDVGMSAYLVNSPPGKGPALHHHPVDEEGVDAADINLVMAQTQTTRAKAVKALKNHKGDLLGAIMEVTESK